MIDNVPDVLSDYGGEEILRLELLEVVADQEGADEDQAAHQEGVGNVVAANRLPAYRTKTTFTEKGNGGFASRDEGV